MGQEQIAALRVASEGLLCRSETEEPFEPFSWGKAEGELTRSVVARLAGAPPGTRVEERPLAAFFQDQGAQDPDRAARYDRLQITLGALLAGARVLRLGAVNLDVYIVGRTGDGDWAGLKSHMVET
jgi:hypothetical protein